jgi:hypothetical protein
MRSSAVSAAASPETHRGGAPARGARKAALEATNARADRDIRLDEVKAGSWFHFMVTTYWLSQWVEAHGETKEVSP